MLKLLHRIYSMTRKVHTEQPFTRERFVQRMHLRIPQNQEVPQKILFLSKCSNILPDLRFVQACPKCRKF